jgi:hypothetical protein
MYSYKTIFKDKNLGYASIIPFAVCQSNCCDGKWQNFCHRNISFQPSFFIFFKFFYFFIFFENRSFNELTSSGFDFATHIHVHTTQDNKEQEKKGILNKSAQFLKTTALLDRRTRTFWPKKRVVFKNLAT